MDLAVVFQEHRIQAALAVALLLGIAFGALAQWKGFCLLRSLEDARVHRRFGKLRVFALAMLAALLMSQALAYGWGIPLQRSVYAQPGLSLGLLFGGLMFGAGMTLANACGARSLVLLGSGNLRSLLTLLCIAVAAGVTMSGVLAPLRMWMAGVNLPVPAATVPQWLASAGLGETAARGIPVALLSVLLLLFILRRPENDDGSAPWSGLAAILIGLLVGLGWFVTGHLGADDFEPMPLASLSFIAPMSESLLYLQLSSGISAGFGVMIVAGVLAGAFLLAIATRSFEWRGFSSVGQMARSMIGGLLMGVGGVLTLGCSIGQGLSGFSTLSLASFVSLPAIVLGSLLMLNGSFKGQSA